MVNYSRNVLDNGLTVIIHHDESTPLVAVNLLYKVGSKDEDPGKTGFTHLFEHLMFGGTKNVPDFDQPIQEAGGENNAFTNADITNFYDVLPLQNLEVALWLESDRMTKLDFSQKVLDVQKKVVIEEFKETTLNEPYGDMWHHVSDMVYKKHPYRWPTIGKEISHIEDASMDDVSSFFYNFYRPNNAIVVVAGNITEEGGLKLVKKWFGHIPKGEVKRLPIIKDPRQVESRFKVVKAKVPMQSLTLAFKMESRLHFDFYVSDLISDILSSGRSSRLYQKLVKEQELFSSIDAFVSGTTDDGIFNIEGKIMKGVSMDQARSAIWAEIDKMTSELMEERELRKIINKVETNLEFSETNILSKAMSLGYYEYLGDIELINSEGKTYNSITTEDIRRVSADLFRKENVCELNYIPIESN